MQTVRRFCLKSKTKTRPCVVPIQISPFAAVTVGVSAAPLPRIAAAFWEEMAGREEDI
jgi:hypothetical protein